jgi:hypothetical protein
MGFEHSIVSMLLFPSGLLLGGGFSVMDYLAWNKTPTVLRDLGIRHSSSAGPGPRAATPRWAVPQRRVVTDRGSQWARRAAGPPRSARPDRSVPTSSGPASGDHAVVPGA